VGTKIFPSPRTCGWPRSTIMAAGHTRKRQPNNQSVGTQPFNVLRVGFTKHCGAERGKSGIKYILIGVWYTTPRTVVGIVPTRDSTKKL
jgi:hypothetical protein